MSDSLSHSCPTCGGSGLPQPFRPDMFDYEDLPAKDQQCSDCVDGVYPKAAVERAAIALDQHPLGNPCPACLSEARAALEAALMTEEEE